jgi:hypothetical protein
MKLKVMSLATAATLLAGVSALAQSENGSAGDMPAFYDHQLFTINFKPQPEGATQAILQHSSAINNLYLSDPGLPGGEMFVAVLDAIQGDGFNQLWMEIQVIFKARHTPRQLYSDDEIAEAAANGQVTLTPTSELYRCAVVGTGPKH